MRFNSSQRLHRSWILRVTFAAIHFDYQAITINLCGDGHGDSDAHADADAAGEKEETGRGWKWSIVSEVDAKLDLWRARMAEKDQAGIVAQSRWSYAAWIRVE